MRGIKYVLIALVVLYACCRIYELLGPNRIAPALNVSGNNGKAPEYAVLQYRRVAENPKSTRIDVCVQAGIVSSAYLQAQDEPNYRKWKAVQKSDCAKANVPQ